MPSSDRGASHWALATVCFVLFLTFLDNTVVSVTLANVQSSLHAGVSALQWVVNGYALVFAGFMLSFGTLGDLLGRKAVMLGGVAVFCVGSVVAAVAPNPGTLIAGRVVMGLGAAASEPGTLSMIRHLYPEGRSRARALGVWTAVTGLALAMGPVVGGVLVGLWSWRAVFWFNLVFGVMALAAAAVVLPESADPTGKRIDRAGGLLGALAVGAATVAVIQGEAAGYRAGWIDALFAAAVVALLLFVVVERRSAAPVLELRYFRVRAFTGSTIVAFTAYFATFALFFLVALYLVVVAARSGYSLALAFLPMAACLMGAALVAGRWVAARGPRQPMLVGCILTAAGLFLTDHYLSPRAGLVTLAATLAVSGIGIGLAMVPVTSTPLAVLPAARSGMAASATNTSRELGAVAGVAVLGSLVNGQLTVDLVRRLVAIGIPPQFRQLVVTAVTTGTVSQQASALGNNKALQAIVNRVESTAYGAFGHGVDLSLLAAASLMLLSALIVAVTMPGAPVPAAR
jgi:EmrB/QacA subfamily drug resistance transporter